MKVAFDIDGTIDSDTEHMRSLMSSLRAAGHKVVVLGGGGGTITTDAEVETKVSYLKHLGIDESCYNKIKIVPNPVPQNKAAYCREHNVDILIDNDIRNADQASYSCTVLVPWGSITPRQAKNYI